MTLALLILQTVVHSTDINDGWILDGILPYFLSFVLLYCSFVGFSQSLESITVATSIFLVTINLIPNLKYSFIYGNFDPLAHYGFVQALSASGRIPQSGMYGIQYGPTPGLSVSLSTLSIVLGVDTTIAMKLFLSFLPALMPLMLYVVVRKAAIEMTLAKATLVSTAIVSPVTYIFTGTSATFFFVFSFLCLYSLLVARGKDLKHVRSYVAMLVLFAVAIVISHTVTSFLLLIFFAITIALSKTRKFSFLKDYVVLALFFVIISLGYLVFLADANFQTLLSLLKETVYSIFARSQPLALGYYSGFYELTLLDRAIVFVVKWGMYMTALVLVCLSTLTIRRITKRPDVRRLYSSHFIMLLFSALVLVLSLFTRAFSDRFVYYFLAVAPPFAGITLCSVTCSRRRNLGSFLLVCALFGLICFNMLQVYPCQPLIPKVQTNYGESYVVDWRQVTTVYDRSLISFASSYVRDLKVAVDGVLWWQIQGLSNTSLQELLTWERPVSGTVPKSPLVLASQGSDSHIIPSGRDRVSYDRFVENAIETDSVLYTNGKSYVLFNQTSSSSP